MTPYREKAVRRRSGGQEATVVADIFERVRDEYAQMPGLRLTVPQAARLWTLRPDDTEAVLDALVASGELYRDATGQYALRRKASGPLARRRAAEAVA